MVRRWYTVCQWLTTGRGHWGTLREGGCRGGSSRGEGSCPPMGCPRRIRLLLAFLPRAPDDLPALHRGLGLRIRRHLRDRLPRLGALRQASWRRIRRSGSKGTLLVRRTGGRQFEPSPNRSVGSSGRDPDTADTASANGHRSSGLPVMISGAHGRRVQVCRNTRQGFSGDGFFRVRLRRRARDLYSSS